MTIWQAKTLFVEEFFKTESEYHKSIKQDYLAVQEMWACYIDGLCKDGIITERQYENATFK